MSKEKRRKAKDYFMVRYHYSFNTLYLIRGSFI